MSTKHSEVECSRQYEVNGALRFAWTMSFDTIDYIACGLSQTGGVSVEVQHSGKHGQGYP